MIQFNYIEIETMGKKGEMEQVPGTNICPNFVADITNQISEIFSEDDDSPVPNTFQGGLPYSNRSN